METIGEKLENVGKSITLKAIIIGLLTLIMLIPGQMIQSLINERQSRSIESIQRINERWSNAQTISGPVLNIPFTTESTDSNDKSKVIERHVLTVAPEKLDIGTTLSPEVRHYGIYKAILYKSANKITGHFVKPDTERLKASAILWDEAYLTMGVSDLRGISNDIDFLFDGKHYKAETGGAAGSTNTVKTLIINLTEKGLFQNGSSIAFACDLKLKGSGEISFIPLGKTTHVEVNGNWASPGFVGNFSPEYKLNDKGFSATWNILNFNRNIPESWTENYSGSFAETSFGVNLVDTVDQYQQNMRSAKYALMFISLTFVVFFFVEVLTKKRIHPIQYLLVGIALILFYSLLLSVSEQIGFGMAYLVSTLATIGLITAYAQSIFRNFKQTAILTGILSVLYIFLYVVLQLEDIALLIGSVGLFLILGIIMFVSRKIKWYRTPVPSLKQTEGIADNDGDKTEV